VNEYYKDLIKIDEKLLNEKKNEDEKKIDEKKDEEKKIDEKKIEEKKDEKDNQEKINDLLVIKNCKAEYDYKAEEKGEINLSENDLIKVLKMDGTF
jgi:hypothetical protein